MLKYEIWKLFCRRYRAGTIPFTPWVAVSPTMDWIIATRPRVPSGPLRRSSRKRAKAQSITAEERTQFASFMMLFFGRLDAEKGWTKQLHLGAQRNVNTLARRTVGADAGYDTIGDFPQGAHLAAYLDLLSQENALPRMIVYNVNPRDTFQLATLIGSFQDGENSREDSIWQRLVVPGPEAGDHGADRRSLEHWTAVAFHRHGDGLAVVHVLSASRVFPARPLRHHRTRRNARRIAR